MAPLKIHPDVFRGELAAITARYYADVETLCEQAGDDREVYEAWEEAMAGVVSELEEQAGGHEFGSPFTTELNRLLKTQGELPYGLTKGELVLDPASAGVELERGMDTLVELARKPASRREFELIVRSWMLLIDADAGSYGECLDTAIVWLYG